MSPAPNHELRAAVAEHLKMGLTYRQVVEATGASMGLVGKVICIHGGVVPKEKKRSELWLSFEQREAISRMLSFGDQYSFRQIAAAINRSPSTVSREVNRNGGRKEYRAWRAEECFQQNLKRPKVPKLVASPRLRSEVEAKLEVLHSPRQVSKRLMKDHPDDPEMRISHEAIYQALFIQGRGALRRELTACLRTGRTLRKPRHREKQAIERIKDKVMIADRPAEVEDRAIPGHWEGDLIKGERNASQIGTLVERSTRYVMLMKLKDGKAETVREALGETVQRLPGELFKTLTWDQGIEMAEHVLFSVDSGVDVYFCDPHSPWQRGSNENTNGLLRQYFPKGTDLSIYSQDELDAVARELNNRPRETLDWMTPAEKLAQLLH